MRCTFRWLARALVVLVFAGALALVLGYRLGPERWWLIAFVEYLPYPVHLAPAIAAVVLSFALGRAFRLIAALSLALVLGPVMGLELHRPKPAEDGIPLRVMTWNIKAHLAAEHPDGFAKLAHEIARDAPDILLLQDAGEPSSLQKTSPHAVESLLGTRYRYGSGQFWIGSRYPLHACAPASLLSAERGDVWIRCLADVDGIEVALYAVHLRTPRHGLNATRREALAGVDEWKQNVADRMAQAEILAGAIRSTRLPVIVGGDLNAPEPSLVVRTLLRAGLRDAFASAGFGYGYTYGHALRPGFSFLRLDHVLVGNGIGVAACRAGGREASEHRPVIAELRVTHTGPGGTRYADAGKAAAR